MAIGQVTASNVRGSGRDARCVLEHGAMGVVRRRDHHRVHAGVVEEGAWILVLARAFTGDPPRPAPRLLVRVGERHHLGARQQRQVLQVLDPHHARADHAVAEPI